jgi:hypothetical protein
MGYGTWVIIMSFIASRWLTMLGLETSPAPNEADAGMDEFEDELAAGE